MVAGEQLLITEGVDIATNRLGRDIEILGQGFDRDKTLLLDEEQNFLLALIHGESSLAS